MAPLPAPGNDGSSGNAIQDANQQIAADIAAFNASEATTTINAINQQNATAASDCLWPPSAKITVPIFRVPVINKTVNHTFQVPCLLTYSEARAMAGAGILAAGLLIIGWGVSIVAVAAAAPTILTIAGAGGSVPGRALGSVGRLGARESAKRPAAAPAPTQAEMTTAS